jgi:hypothetical protein
MKLFIDPEWSSDAEKIVLDIKQTGLQNKIEDHLVRVIDGSWTFMIEASWYRNQANTRPNGNSILSEGLEKYDQWFFYSTAQFKKKLGFADSAFPFLHFESGQGFEFLKGICYAIILNAPIQATWDSPSEISGQKRQEIADLVQLMPLNYPDQPTWADVLPVAILGNSFQFGWNEAGSVFCSVNKEFALELSIMAGLHNRRPTEQEIQLIEAALP